MSERRPWFGEIVQDVLDPVYEQLRQLTYADINQKVADLLSDKYEPVETDIFVVVWAANQYALHHAPTDPADERQLFAKDDILSSVKTMADLFGEPSWVKD